MTWFQRQPFGMAFLCLVLVSASVGIVYFNLFHRCRSAEPAIKGVRGSSQQKHENGIKMKRDHGRKEETANLTARRQNTSGLQQELAKSQTYQTRQEEMITYAEQTMPSLQERESNSARFQTQRTLRQNEVENYTPNILILYWSNVFGRRVRVLPSGRNLTRNWPFFYAGKKGECPVPCEVSSDHSRANEASAFVVHAKDTHMIPPSKNVPWILQTNENPVYTPKLKDSQFMSQFKLLVSYRLDSDFPSPIYPMPDLTPPVPFTVKYDNVLAVFSNCESVRTEYMKQLMKYVKVDSYGSCLHNKDGLIGVYGTAFKQRKMELSRHYKFTLVFMNQDCDYFVDDRLYHALASGSVPVFMGTDKVDEFLPGNLKTSIIKVRDFKSPKDLADHLKYLGNNETAYNKYLEWKSKGLGDVAETVIGRWWLPKYPLFCQVCMALAEGRLHEEGLKRISCKRRSPQDWAMSKTFG